MGEEEKSLQNNPDRPQKSDKTITRRELIKGSGFAAVANTFFRQGTRENEKSQKLILSPEKILNEDFPHLVASSTYDALPDPNSGIVSDPEGRILIEGGGVIMTTGIIPGAIVDPENFRLSPDGRIILFSTGSILPDSSENAFVQYPPQTKDVGQTIVVQRPTQEGDKPIVHIENGKSCFYSDGSDANSGMITFGENPYEYANWETGNFVSVMEPTISIIRNQTQENSGPDINVLRIGQSMQQENQRFAAIIVGENGSLVSWSSLRRINGNVAVNADGTVAAVEMEERVVFDEEGNRIPYPMDNVLIVPVIKGGQPDSVVQQEVHRRGVRISAEEYNEHTGGATKTDLVGTTKNGNFIVAFKKFQGGYDKHRITALGVVSVDDNGGYVIRYFRTESSENSEVQQRVDGLFVDTNDDGEPEQVLTNEQIEQLEQRGWGAYKIEHGEIVEDKSKPEIDVPMLGGRDYVPPPRVPSPTEDPELLA